MGKVKQHFMDTQENEFYELADNSIRSGNYERYEDWNSFMQTKSDLFNLIFSNLDEFNDACHETWHEFWSKYY